MQVNGDGVCAGRQRRCFTFQLTAAGNWTFTLVDQLDHARWQRPAGDTETIALSLASVFVATDFDGDSVIIDAGATVTIENDMPLRSLLNMPC